MKNKIKIILLNVIIFQWLFLMLNFLYNISKGVIHYHNLSFKFFFINSIILGFNIILLQILNKNKF